MKPQLAVREPDVRPWMLQARQPTLSAESCTLSSTRCADGARGAGHEGGAQSHPRRAPLASGRQRISEQPSKLCCRSLLSSTGLQRSQLDLHARRHGLTSPQAPQTLPRSEGALPALCKPYAASPGPSVSADVSHHACSFCLMSERTSGSTWVGSMLMRNFHLMHDEDACPNKVRRVP